MDSKEAALTGIHFKHYNYKNYYGDKKQLAYTVAYRFLGTGEMDVAVAQCSSKDNFNKRTGRELSSERLVKGDCVRVMPPRVEGRLFNFHMFMTSLISKRALILINRNGASQHIKYKFL